MGLKEAVAEAKKMGKMEMGLPQRLRKRKGEDEAGERLGDPFGIQQGVSSDSIQVLELPKVPPGHFRFHSSQKISGPTHD